MFSDINISQGSTSTRLRCGDLFSHYFIANLQESVTVKKIENQSILSEDMDKHIVTHGVPYSTYLRWGRRKIIIVGKS